MGILLALQIKEIRRMGPDNALHECDNIVFHDTHF